ncbi:DUF1360 domain-containing protein [Neobacillus mesonae]|uniref:DUF1360 domain-containing protein n=1 Tax=Neobacillus mesonae TaxID=1193713 RepID=UPI00203BCDB0|nr:DUF1360 domain-containing protein [Neobacillus mesonae]MCM3569970.1 DUF1360 domain-containing protein [Neobacillus mesonae]
MKDITFLQLLILSFASFRLTRLLVFDKITEFLRAPFFDEVEMENEVGELEVYYSPKQRGFKHFMGELLSCYWCTGIWMAALVVAIFFLFPVYSVPIILILAIAGIASLIETIIQRIIEK